MGKKLHIVTLGDTLTPLGVQLVRMDENGVYTPVDLTGLTVKFKMTDYYGADVVVETVTGVSVIDALTGKVQYDFQPADVDTAGDYFAWFMVYNGSERDTFPVDGRTLCVRVVRAS
jgi:hypothetical protein